MRAGSFLYFLFSATDQARIVPTSIKVEDTPYSKSPTAGTPIPQSMRLSFTVRDPQNGPLSIRCLFPGKMTFIADPAASGDFPEPDDVEFTEAAHTTWKTKGSLMINILDGEIAKRYNELATTLEVRPNRVWYSPVLIPKEFLFTSLRSGLKKSKIPGVLEGKTIDTTNLDWWAKHAISYFLIGKYAPEVQLGSSNASSDDVNLYPMPTVEMTANGDVTLIITGSICTKPPRCC